MEIQDRLKEAHEVKNEMVKQLQQIRTTTGQLETAIIKQLGKIEALTELVPKEEKTDGTH